MIYQHYRLLRAATIRGPNSGRCYIGRRAVACQGLISSSRTAPINNTCSCWRGKFTIDRAGCRIRRYQHLEAIPRQNASISAGHCGVGRRTTATPVETSRWRERHAKAAIAGHPMVQARLAKSSAARRHCQ